MSSLKRAILRLRGIFSYFPLENILLFFLKGNDYRAASSKLVPSPEQYSKSPLRRVQRGGIHYELDRSCMMQWYVYWDFKDKTRDCLYSLVSEGDVILDIGTNIGETLLTFAKLTGDRGFVYGFEPDSHNFSNVEKNISLNSFKNLHVFNKGVSDKKETVRLYRVDEHNLGMNRILSDDEAAKFKDYSEIKVDTLDNVLTENRIDKVDLIKIDIEGFEMHALRGAESTLRRFMPRLFIEVGYTRLLNNGSSPTELVAFLNDIGYSVFHSDTDEPISKDFDFFPLGDGGIDVFALPEKSSDQ